MTPPTNHPQKSKKSLTNHQIHQQTTPTTNHQIHLQTTTYHQIHTTNHH